MANQMPIPLPPRTPTPPIDGHSENSPPGGLGLDPYHKAPSPIRIDYDYDLNNGLSESPPKHPDTARTIESMLSPTSATFSASLTPMSNNSSLYSPITPQTGSIDGGFQPLENADDNGGRNPFNFTTQQYTAHSPRGSLGRIAASEAIGRRKGHKYKHSSIHLTHSIFEAPAPRAPLALPASLPMPTRKEAYFSMTTEQTFRFTWCICHFLVAAYVQFSAAGSLAMTALSRLLLFDAAGAVVCVLVDVMCNFEVWKRSSIKHPFGLERADVLAGFGMAVFMSFMGLDIISHGIQHSLENVGSHVPHSPHDHSEVTFKRVDFDVLLALCCTIISALLLKNHARIGKAMRLEFIPRWGRILGNPSHMLTLGCSTLLLFLPAFSGDNYNRYDAILSFFIAVLMIAFGVRLGTSLASMLLMSYPGAKGTNSVKDVIAELEQDPAVAGVEEARFWQVHYGLCMANLKLKYRAGALYGDDVARLRQRLVSLIRNRLGGGYGMGSGGVKWEVSTQLALEMD